LAGAALAGGTVARVSRPTSFYYAFLVLPPQQRRAIVAVWDFCRAVDDAADEEPAPAANDRGVAFHRPAVDGTAARRALLGEWRRELERCYAGTPQTSQGRHLQPWIRQFCLSRRPFEDLIDGVEMDLDHARYPTFDALYEYCWRVASTVGLVCIEIFGARSSAAREYAISLGVALQLTNIVRDVSADAASGRIYLPQTDLARFGCSEDALRADHVTDPVREVLAFECERARHYYAEARARLPHAERRALVAAEIMGRIYRDVLRKIERARYDVFSGRVHVPRPRQAVLAVDTWTRNRLGIDVPV
jgi:phytoene synthase